MKTSLSYKMSNVFFKFINYKKPFRNEKAFARFLRKKQKKYHTLFPVIQRLSFDKLTIDDMDYYDINKKGTKTILFIPGGSYIDNPTEIHWLFVEKLTSMCDARIIMPIYPKLPLHNYKECYSKLEKLMTLMPEDLIFLADSAGGGLALGLALKGYHYQKMILISPWVDIRMDNDEMKEIESHDPVLSIMGLKKLGELWSLGELSYLTSPLIGNIEGLDNVFVFGGTNEIFLPDIRLFAARLNKTCRYFEYHNMNHGFVLHPIKEAKAAQNLVIDIINNKYSVYSL